MPIAYQIYSVDRFPVGTQFQTGEQLSLLADDEQNQEIAVSRIKLSGKSAASPLIRYDAEHEFLFKLEYPGRARGKTFGEFIAPYKFPVFLGEHVDGISFKPLFVRTKKKVALDLIHRLNRHVEGFCVSASRLDFSILRPRLELIRGAWFGSMRQPNISTAAVFGPHVDRSDEFLHAESVGELRSLQIEIVQGDLVHTVMLSADGAIVLYNAYQSEIEELEVILCAMSGLLSGCFSAARL